MQNNSLNTYGHQDII